ncbi:MAG: sodium:proton antiporter [Desulfurococcales archaeon ex4484_217_2]|nr:MAG: sodium:proton antiporter [Desulfurococcales archaeon ex4484_217_2]
MISVGLLIIAYLATVAVIFTYKAIVEKDLIKAIVYSAGQSVAYAIAYAALLAPDIMLAYIAIGVGVYSIILLYVVSKTSRFEEA